MYKVEQSQKKSSETKATQKIYEHLSIFAKAAGIWKYPTYMYVFVFVVANRQTEQVRIATAEDEN